jgi:nitrogen regulatory protein P-II 1
MRLVLALIQPTKLAAVQDALARIGIGVERMTVCDALGYGRQGGDHAPRSAAAGDFAEPPALLRKVALEIAVNEDFLERTVETIVRVARSGPEGTIGDGKVFVLPIEEVVRLSDTIRGPEAVS